LNDVVLERPNDGSSTENPLREVISTVELTQEELELEVIEMEKIVGKGFLRAREVEFMTGLQQTAYFNKYGGLGSYKKLRQEKWYKMTIEQQEAQWKVLPQQQKLSDCHQKSD
jgi:hypothetical protein